MAQYTKSQLVSASNATYFTNTSGGISASAVRDLNDSWISSSALLSGSNTFIGNQIISGNLDISGTITASLQTGYLYVGDSSGKTQAVATSSIIANTNTGSLLVTASFASTNITFTKGDTSQFSLDGFATTGSNTFIGNQTITTAGNTQLNIESSGPAFSNQTNIDFRGNNSNFNAYGDFNIINNGQFGGSGSIKMLVKDNEMQLAASQGFRMGVTNALGNAIEGGAIIINVPSGSQQFQLTGSLNVSNTLTASLAQGYAWVGNSSNVSSLVATSSFGTSIDTGSFATTGSNTFYGSQTISGSVLPLNNFGGNLGSSGQNWTNLYVNEILGLSNLRTDTIKFNGVTLPLASIQPRQLFGNGIDASTAMYYGTSSSDVNALRELAYVQSGSPTTPDMNILSASFASTIGSIVTGTGFLTTGSLAFGGSTNKGNGLYQFNVATGGAGYAIEIFNTGSDALYGGTGSMRFGITDPGNPFIQLKGQPWFQFGTGNQLQYQTFTGSFDQGIIIGPYYTASAKVHLMPRSSSLQFLQDIGAGEVPIFTLGTKDFSNPSQSIFETDLRVKGQFTASLANGFTYVGNASGISTLVATSSFGSSISTGSLLVTASFDTTTRDITFTKGDATTFKLGGFATTGSNVFTGKQTMPALDMSGSITFPNGAVIGPNSVGQSTLISSQTALQISSSVNATIFASALTLDAARTDVKGVETIGDMSRTGNGEVYLLGRSGSLIIGNSVNSATYAALSHLSSSAINGNTNLIFKTNSNTGTTIISGSGNIFTNPNTPTTGYIRYIGGSNNLYLNNSNGVNSQITASAASVSGARPVMNNNIFAGTANFVLNYASNAAATQNISSNITAVPAGNSFTINALAHTGSMDIYGNLTMGSDGGITTLNPVSASVAEIALGLSGSGAFIYYNNINNNGTITITSNRNIPAATTTRTTGNIITGGTLTITNISSSANVSAVSNISNGTITYSNAGAAGLALHRVAGNISANYGPLNLIASASTINAANNICSSALTVTNRSYSGSLGSGSISFNNNSVNGAGNTYTVSGSYNGSLASGAGFLNNAVFGSGNTFFTNVEGRGNYVAFSSNGIFGANLILTGSNNTVLIEQGGAHIGRYNANDGIRNTTGENIFSVGTGVLGSRKTGFLIDSGSNSYFEGTLNVSGSTVMTGSLILSSSAATELFVIGNTEMTGSLAVSSFTTLASVSSSLNFADDTAAAAGGVPLGGLYRNGNFVMIRLT